MRCIGATISWLERGYAEYMGKRGYVECLWVFVLGIPNFTGFAENCIFLQFKHQIFGYGPFLHLLPTDPCP